MLLQIILFLRYMLAEGLGLSGIVSILFTGMVIASYIILLVISCVLKHSYADFCVHFRS